MCQYSEAMGSNPVEALKIFFGLKFIPAVQINFRTQQRDKKGRSESRETGKRQTTPALSVGETVTVDLKSHTQRSTSISYTARTT